MELLRTRLCEWKPLGIDALALAPPNFPEPRLAVGRASGYVELWNTETWQLQITSPGRGTRSVRSLVWFDDSSSAEGSDGSSPARRLLSAGLHGEITDWDLTSMKPFVSIGSGGGAVWQLCFDNHSRVLGACDDGSIRIFTLGGGSDNPIAYERRINVGKGRLLSIAAPRAKAADPIVYAGGSDGRISKWSLTNFTCTGSMQVEKAKGVTDVLVWSLSCLADGLLASGDSLGLVLIWDPVTCVILHRFQQHQADVLALAASADGRTLLSGGIDAKISTFCQSGGGSERWVYFNSEMVHTHDIRAIACEGETEVGKRPKIFVAGGAAGKLVIHFPKQPRTLGGSVIDDSVSSRPLECSSFLPTCQTASISEASRLMLCQNLQHLELWYLERPKAAGQLPEAQFLLRVFLGDSSPKPGEEKGEHIICSAISANGSHIVASSLEGTRLFKLSLGELELQKVKTLPAEISNVAARAVVFCGSANGLLAVASYSGSEILILDCAGLTIVARFQEHESPVSLLAADGPGEWLASADFAGKLHVFSLDGLQHQARLPIGTLHGFPTALGFDAPGRMLIVVLSKHAVLFFDLEAQALAAHLPAPAMIPKSSLAIHERVCGIIAPTRTPKKFLLWGHTFLLALSISASSRPGVGNGRRDERRKEDVASISWQKTPLEHILSLHALDEAKWGPNQDEADGLEKGPDKKKRRSEAPVLALSLEVAAEAVEKALPARFERKKFE